MNSENVYISMIYKLSLLFRFQVLLLIFFNGWRNSGFLNNISQWLWIVNRASRPVVRRLLKGASGETPSIRWIKGINLGNFKSKRLLEGEKGIFDPPLFHNFHPLYIMSPHDFLTLSKPQRNTLCFYLLGG